MKTNDAHGQRNLRQGRIEHDLPKAQGRTIIEVAFAAVDSSTAFGAETSIVGLGEVKVKNPRRARHEIRPNPFFSTQLPCSGMSMAVHPEQY